MKTDRMNAIDDRITALLREVFANHRLQVTPATTPADIPGWDSLTHVKLITAVEEEFDIKLGVRDVMKMNSVGAIRDVVASKLAV